MMAWDSDNPTPVTPLGDLLYGLFGGLAILLIGITMGVIIGQERGLASCPEAVDRFSEFRVAYVSVLDGVQMVQLVGPDSVLVVVE